MSNAFKTQIGGTHYSEFAIQPTEYITKNKLGWYEGNCVKYISRHKLKGGADDIRKVIHYAQMLLESTYGVTCKISYPTEEVTKKPRKKRTKKVITIVPTSISTPE